MSLEPPKALDPFSQRRQAAKWRRLARLRNTIIGIWLGGLASNLVIPAIILELFPSLKDLALGVMVALAGCWISACVAGIALETYLNQHFQQTLASNDLSSLGCWIDALFSPISKWAYPQAARRHYDAARAGLLEHLPHLTEETASLLRSSDRLTLYKTLQAQDTDIIRAVLKAIPVFGDSRALPYLRSLAAGKGAGADAALQAEAASTLAVLETQLAQGNGAQGLLRASQPPQATAGEMLRAAAHATNESEATELLRAEIHK
jgi:hypothetical protein